MLRLIQQVEGLHPERPVEAFLFYFCVFVSLGLCVMWVCGILEGALHVGTAWDKIITRTGLYRQLQGVKEFLIQNNSLRTSDTVFSSRDVSVNAYLGPKVT